MYLWNQDLRLQTLGRPCNRASRHHFLGPRRQSRSPLVHQFSWSVQRSDTHQPLHGPLLRFGVLQDLLPRLPTGFGTLHLQPRVLESPCGSSTVASCPRWNNRAHLLRQLGHSRSHKLRQSHRPSHQRIASGTLVDCSLARRPA